MSFSGSHVTAVNKSDHTLQGALIEIVKSHKYFGIWLDDRLSFQSRVENLTKKLRRKIGFLYRSKSGFSTLCKKTIVKSSIMSILDYGDVLYMYASTSTLNPFDAVFHSALCFITVLLMVFLLITVFYIKRWAGPLFPIVYYLFTKLCLLSFHCICSHF